MLPFYVCVALEVCKIEKISSENAVGEVARHVVLGDTFFHDIHLLSLVEEMHGLEGTFWFEKISLT